MVRGRAPTRCCSTPPTPAEERRARTTRSSAATRGQSGTVKPLDFVRFMRLPSGRAPRLDWLGHNPFPFRMPNLPEHPAGGRLPRHQRHGHAQRPRCVAPIGRPRPAVAVGVHDPVRHGSAVFATFVSRAEQAQYLTAGLTRSPTPRVGGGRPRLACAARRAARDRRAPTWGLLDLCLAAQAPFAAMVRARRASGCGRGSGGARSHGATLRGRRAPRSPWFRGRPPRSAWNCVGAARRGRGRLTGRVGGRATRGFAARTRRQGDTGEWCERRGGDGEASGGSESLVAVRGGGAGVLGGVQVRYGVCPGRGGVVWRLRPELAGLGDLGRDWITLGARLRCAWRSVGRPLRGADLDASADAVWRRGCRRRGGV